LKLIKLQVFFGFTFCNISQKRVCTPGSYVAAEAVYSSSSSSSSATSSPVKKPKKAASPQSQQQQSRASRVSFESNRH
jgi:hypothetical protein